MIDREAGLRVGDDGRPVHGCPLRRRARNVGANPGTIATHQPDEFRLRERRGGRNPVGRKREAAATRARRVRKVDRFLECVHRRGANIDVALELARVFGAGGLIHHGRRVVDERQVAECHAAQELRVGLCPVVARRRAEREAGLVQRGQDARGDANDFVLDAVDRQLLRGAAIPDRVVVWWAGDGDPLPHAVVRQTGEVLERLYHAHEHDTAGAAPERGVPPLVVGANERLDVRRRGQNARRFRAVRVLHLQVTRAHTEQRRDDCGGSDPGSIHIHNNS